MHLVPFHRNHTVPHTPLSRLVPLSCPHSFVLLRAHIHNRPDLSIFASPWGGVCVCVNPCAEGFATTFTITTVSQAGGHSSFHQSVANEATDDWRGYEPGTPGSRTCFPFQLLTSCPLSLFCFHGSSCYHPQTFSHRRFAADFQSLSRRALPS